jgi:hypothetical protein
MWRQTLVPIFVAVALTACGGAPTKPADKPDWIDGSSSRYPPELYVTGRGQSRQLDDAKNRARADLAQTFQVHIVENQKDVQAYSAAKVDGKTTETKSASSVTRTITTSTDQVVRGVQIGDTWHDTAGGDYYALAILPRQQAANALRQEIVRLDEATRIAIDAAANSLDPLDKIAKAHRALNAQIERLAFQRSLQVVDRSGEGVRPVWSISQLQNDFEKLLQRTRVRVVVINDDGGQAQELVTGAVANAGFSPDAAADADFALEVALNLEDLGQKSDGWYWSTGALEIKLVDKAGKTRGGKRWPVKVSAQEKPMVAQRAKAELTRVLDQELRATLIGFATAP